MSMVINTNLGADNANRLLAQSSRDQAQAMERLTSGSKINSSADNAAGLSIATAMTSQIMGTDQAIRNANNGISMIQTLDGSSGSMVDMLQRMRELSVQSLNGTFTTENRSQMNLEFEQLTSEIDRIAGTTKFNEVSLMNHVDATGNRIAGAQDNINIHVGWETGASNNIGVELGDFNTEGSVSVGLTAGLLATATAAGSAAQSALTTSQSALAISRTGLTDLSAALSAARADLAAASAGQSVALALIVTDASAARGVGSAALGTASAATLVLTAAATTAAATLTSATTAATTATTAALGNGYIFNNLVADDITTAANASAAIINIDASIQNIGSLRAEWGALQNRMESTVSNLTNVNENVTTARSQIMDADFAKESANLARTQVLQQAGMSMLSQANQQAQNVLALLR